MSEPTEIATEIETTTGLDTLLLVKALQNKKEREQEIGCEEGVEAIDRLLEQTKRTTAYAVIVGDDDE
jgi:hypothetical protein